MPHPIAWSPEQVRRAIEMFRGGRAIPEIEANIGVNQHRVRRFLMACITDYKALSDRNKRAKFRAVGRRIAADESRYFRRARVESRRLAEMYGLPADLTPRDVARILALADGPQTTAALMRRFAIGKGAISPPLNRLKRRGLAVCFASKVRSFPRSAVPMAWMLTARCLDMLAQKTTGVTP